MLQLIFTDRVLLYESDSDRASDFVKQGIASRRLANGSASIHSRDGRGRVSAIRAVIVRRKPEQLQSVRPGSFGVRKFTSDGRDAGSTEYGATVFDHKNPMDGFGNGSAICVPVVLVRDAPVKRAIGYTDSELEEMESAELAVA